MSYQPAIPQFLGTKLIPSIDLSVLVRYIDWRFFFAAWDLADNYEDIGSVCSCASCETAWLQNFDVSKREKAKEALSLFRDAQIVLREMANKKQITAQSIVGFFPAVSKNEGIEISVSPLLWRGGKGTNASDKTNWGEVSEVVFIPTLRQQELHEGDYLSLCDFIAPTNDFIGVFAVSIDGGEALAKECEQTNDDYKSLLVKSLSDRLAAAAAEWLHEQIRKEYWGFAADERLPISDMLKGKYASIRPAVGYPSLPDQSVIFQLDSLLDLSKIGISITENGAMFPNSSICGMVIAHPQARYFYIGKIGNDQLEDYAKRKGISIDEARRWLAKNT